VDKLFNSKKLAHSCKNGQTFACNLEEANIVYTDLHTSEQKKLTDDSIFELALCSDNAYRSILTTTLDGFWAVSPQGKLLDVNHRYIEQSGYLREELLNMRIIDLEAIESVEANRHHILRVVEKGCDQFESRHRRKNGTFWDVEVSVTYDSNKRLFYAFLRDITERKRMEESLKTSEAFTISVLDSLASHIAVLDNQGTIVAVNRAWRIFSQQNGGSDANQTMLGCNYLDVCIKTIKEDNCKNARECEEIKEILHGIKAVMAREQPEFHAEYPCHSPNEQRWFHMTVLPLRGIKRGVVISHKNITDRKQMELELRIAAVAFESQEAIVITDAQNVILRINKAFTEYTGYTEQEVVGQKMNILKSGKHDAAFYTQMWDTILSTGSWQGEILDKRKNGEIYPAWTTITAVKNNAGVITHYVGIHTDITEHKQREEEIRLLSDSELNKAKLEAEKANRAKSDFLSSMSHELRTPMNAVLGFAQLLEMEDLTEEQKEYVGSILTASTHLLELITKVLALTNIENAKLNIVADNVDLNSIVQSCIAWAQPLTLKNNIKIVDNITSTSQFTLLVHLPSFKQVLHNLISNAILYNRANGSVSLSCEVVNPQTLRINVTDTGNGLSELQLSKLFQAFERLGAKNSNIGGAGIGLYLSKKLIEAMNGKIGVSSTVGVGSCFWIDVSLVSAND
jgi:PAS domain S-box-containing protein